MTGLSRDARVDLVERSGLFDMDWYVMRYGDVAQVGMHPVWHYLKSVSYTHLTLPTNREV